MRALIVAVALASSACANVTPYIVTGKSLVLLETQFADTGEAMNKGLDEGKVSKEDYRKWVEFGKRFKVLDKLAFDGWMAAIEINDQIAAGQFGAALGRLAAELIGFYDLMKAAKLLPPGAP